MEFKLEMLLPIGILILVSYAVWYNAFDVPAAYNNQILVETETSPHLMRTVGEVDGTITIKHNATGEVLDLSVFDNYILFPPGVSGSKKVKDSVTGEMVDIWDVKFNRDRYLFDPGFDLGTYAGYLSGDKTGTDVKNLDVGARVSPARWLYGGVSFPDFLVSNQGFGVGVSVYPEPIHFGNFIDHIGVGYARFYTFEDNAPRSLFYVGISTRF